MGAMQKQWNILFIYKPNISLPQPKEENNRAVADMAFHITIIIITLKMKAFVYLHFIHDSMALFTQ